MSLFGRTSGQASIPSGRVRLYVIYDRVAEEAGPIWSAVNDGVARRGYREMMQQVADPDEYQLLWVGEMDVKTLALASNPTPLKIELPPPVQFDLPSAKPNALTVEEAPHA